MQRMAQVKMHSQCVINADGSAEIRSAAAPGAQQGQTGT